MQPRPTHTSTAVSARRTQASSMLSYENPLRIIFPRSTVVYAKKFLSRVLFSCFLNQNVDHKFKFHSKKGQLPFIEINGQQIGDSTTIIKELSQKFEKDIDAGLTKEQKNISHAMISMVENHLTFVILSWRAKNPGEMINGYKINFQQSLGSKIPNAILSFFFRLNYGHRVSRNAIKV